MARTGTVVSTKPAGVLWLEWRANWEMICIIEREIAQRQNTLNELKARLLETEWELNKAEGWDK